MSPDHLPGSAHEGGLRPEVAARVYDRIGKLQDTQAPIERGAVDRLVAQGRFDTAIAVFELGCGTGTLAQRLLDHHLPSDATYLGLEVSQRMAELTRQRLAPWPARARVIHTDGRLPLPIDDASVDRFIAAYVFDLLPHDYALQVIRDTHRILKPGGLLCLTSLTRGDSSLARIVSTCWHALWRVAPRVVGGCRPIDLELLLENSEWTDLSTVVVQSWGFLSQVVVATAQ